MVFPRKGGGFAPVHRDLDRSVREKGVGDTANSRVYKSIGKCLLGNPHSSHLHMNKQLHSLGWDDLDLDYRTFEIATACFENGGLESFDRLLRIKQH